jgi:hypothetical protein
MNNHTGPLYEVSFAIDSDVLSDVDLWLTDIVESSRGVDGIENAHLVEHGTDDHGRTVRSCQFRAIDDNALDGLLDGFFSEIDAQVAKQFGESVTVDSRTLRADHSHELPDNESPVCLNCGTRLRGQYCGTCGQRSRSRLISIWQLLKEAFGDLLELDSRLWRTLLPLLIRPGRLTRDYLEGRRARYMPPFRTYLVLSVIFFVVAFFNPQDDLSVFFEPEPEPTAEEIAALEEKAKVTAAEEKEILDATLGTLKALEADGKISEGIIAEIIDDDDDFNVSIVTDGEGNDFFGDCESASISNEDDAPDWVKKNLTDDKIKLICENNKARGVDSFGDAVIDNVPVALIVLLPIMALVLKLLYPLSRRYFVEHLLFFVHFHAFLFLILILEILFARMLGLLGPEDGAIDNFGSFILAATSFYIPVYLYKAMRLVYGQGHLINTLKYITLVVAYLTGATITMLGALLFAVLSAPTAPLA